MASTVASTSELPTPATQLDVSSSVSSLESNPAPQSQSQPSAIVQDKFQDSNSLAAKAAASASGWNAMLNYTRRERGPMWDFGTAMYHVPSDSPEYYAGVKRVARNPSQQMDSMGSMYPNQLGNPPGQFASPQNPGNDSGRARRSAPTRSKR